jgi:FAD/FMN-containing dehydrogenase
MPKHIRTVCLEFFGDVKRAVPAIVEIKNYLDKHPKAILAGLEHLDERYVKAVGYATKAKSRGRPRMILIADIVSDDESACGEAASHVVRIANARDGEGFVAVTAEQRKRFWLDRARTAAISRHTNAFKINEDVVIPLDKLGEYTEGIERINIEFSIANKLQLASRLAQLFTGELPVYADGLVDRAVLYGDRPQQALELLDRVARRWAFVATNLDALASSVRTDLEGLGMDSAAIGQDREETVFARVQLHNMRISWKKELLEPLRAIFAGRDFEPMMKAIEAAHAEVLRGRVFVALHMHAGDGNVHTNIPVNSDDYEMLRQANGAVARIMKFARRAGRGDLGRARHRRHQDRIPHARRARALRRVQAPRGSRGPLQQGKAARGRGPAQCLYAVVRAHRARIAHPRAERHRRDRRHVQGLPALRQVQARVLDARPARQSPLQPEEQDPRHVAPDGSLPLRGADASRRFDPPLRRIR